MGPSMFQTTIMHRELAFEVVVAAEAAVKVMVNRALMNVCLGTDDIEFTDSLCRR